MVHVIGASSLHKAVKRLDNNLKKDVTTIPGLSFVHNSRYKQLDFLLGGSLAKKKRVVIWHDLLNNSVTSHSSNNYRPLKIEDLIERLKKVKSLAAVVYCRRIFAPDFYDALKKVGVPVISVTRNLISKQKQGIPDILHKYRQLHQQPTLEQKSLGIVIKYKDNLKGLEKNRRSKKRKISQSRRKARQRKLLSN